VAFIMGTQVPWAVAIVLFAFAVHSLAQSKFVGHTILIVYWIGSIALPSLGYQHQLLAVGVTPYFRYSDMNGFGYFVSNLGLQGGYSVSFGLMAAVLAMLAWSAVGAGGRGPPLRSREPPRSPSFSAAGSSTTPTSSIPIRRATIGRSSSPIGSGRIAPTCISCRPAWWTSMSPWSFGRIGGRIRGTADTSS
jgi:hypothetical protein